MHGKGEGACMAKGGGHACRGGGHAWQVGRACRKRAVFILLECILVFKNDQLLLSIVFMNNGQNGSSPTLSVIQPVTIDTMLNNNGPSFSKVMCNQGLSRSGKKRHRTFIFTLTMHG